MDWQSLWTVLQPYAAGQLRHGLTLLAGILVGAGALSSDQIPAFVSIGFTLLVWAIGVIWSVVEKREIPRLRAENARLAKMIVDYMPAKKPAAPSVAKQ